MMTMYTSKNVRVIEFSGILDGKFAAYETDKKAWYDAFELARKLGIEIKRGYGYKGSTKK